jgi:hypothetical protein
MAVKTQKKKGPSGARELPPGVKPWRGPLDPKLAKMIREDRGVASGGRNIVRRKK